METMVRTAGMVQGTPDWQLDRLYELETDRMQAEAYEEDHFDYSIMNSDCNEATYHLGRAVDYLCRASNDTVGSQAENAFDEIINKLEDLRCDIDAIRYKFYRR